MLKHPNIKTTQNHHVRPTVLVIHRLLLLNTQLNKVFEYNERGSTSTQLNVNMGPQQARVMALIVLCNLLASVSI